MLVDYSDQQLLHLIKFSLPLDFNRNCPLRYEEGNHSSATENPKDIGAYIEEEHCFNAILGPFETNPVPRARS